MVVDASMSSSASTASAVVYFQDKCLAHRYTRSQDTSLVFERPERLRAVKTGVAIAIARLEECCPSPTKPTRDNPEVSLSEALQRLNILDEPNLKQEQLSVVMSSSSINLLNNKAVKYVHGDIDRNTYLEKLVDLVRESEEKFSRGESEIPEGWSQGDLYLCSKSLEAIQGALGTVCEAIDTVCRSSPPAIPPSSGPTRAFVAIRPPGHHCGEDTPAGFCFVNNVVVGAAHAYLEHNVCRVVILDIDLHHGNGTQSLVWQINEEAYRQSLEEEGSSENKRALQIFYGSLHDPLSYPCEDGNLALVQAASVSIHGAHGQHIENIHLSAYDSEPDFWKRLYAGTYAGLLDKAEAFLKKGGGDALILISAGFDASEHETESMSRHGCKLPTSFYHRFARDARKLADRYAGGRIVSVLEGGYSDRALCSGVMAHTLGLAEISSEVQEEWWSIENITKAEKAMRKRRGVRTSTSGTDVWLDRAVSLLAKFDPAYAPSPRPIPPSTMMLRNKSKVPTSSSSSSSVSVSHADSTPPATDATSEIPAQIGGSALDAREDKKALPRVILRVNPPHGD